jgi:hypothetical protein
MCVLNAIEPGLRVESSPAGLVCDAGNLSRLSDGGRSAAETSISAAQR